MRQEEFAQLNTRVFIISFGTLPAVQRWMQETCGSFDTLLDPERVAYRAYGLERSLLRSRNLQTRWYYFKAWLAGQKTHAAHGDDTSQLGGDFIVDKLGMLRFVHPSHDPTDRPAVERLMEVLKTLA